MLYGLVLRLLFAMLCVHYILRTDASPRSKTIIGALLAAELLFAHWMPPFLSLSIQFGVSAYILMLYRLQGLSTENP
jgi:hypothetical protein